MSSRLAHDARRTPAALRRVAGTVSALGLLAPLASACPSCSVGQAVETLALVLAFMLIPYLVVSGVWFWMRRLLASEELDS